MKSNLKSKYSHSRTNTVVNINKKSMILENHNNKINWKRYKISDIGVVTGGGTPSTKIKKYFNGDIPWITPKDLSNYKKIYIGKGRNNITEEGLLNSSARLLQKNTILFTTRAPIGYVAIAKNILTTNQGFKSITCNDETHNIFIYYWLKHNKENIECLASGTTFGEISGSTLKNIELDLPRYNKQKEIAKILYDLDMKIENLQKQNKILEQMAQAIFKSWFVDFDGITEFEDSELGKIPKRWKISKLGEKCSLILGGTPSRLNDSYWKDGIVPWINSGKTNEFRIISPTEYITLKAVKKSATKLLPKKTTVLAITGATLGQISIIEIDTCANQSVVGIVESDSMPTEYIYFWLHHIINKIINYQTGGAQQHINKTNIHNTQILIPPQSILNNYKKITCPIFDKITTICFEIKNLIEIRDILLPKLLSGEIKV